MKHVAIALAVLLGACAAPDGTPFLGHPPAYGAAAVFARMQPYEPPPVQPMVICRRSGDTVFCN